MKINNIKIPKKVLLEIDMQNTFHGGSIASFKSDEIKDNYFILKITTPGISVDDLRIEIDGRKILVYQDYVAEFLGKENHVHRLLNVARLPMGAIINELEAIHDQQILTIKVPLKSSNQVNKRRIDIKRKY